MTPTLRLLLSDYRYAIVDRARVRRLPDGLALHPLVPARLEKSAHVLPSLVDLSEVNADVRAACLERLEVEGGNDASLFCGLLRCDSGLATLSNGLRSALIASFDGEDRYFRYFDPRVFCQLAWILDAAQYRRVFSSATSWAYPIDGSWHVASRPAATPLLRLRFNADVVDKLDQLELINRVIDGLSSSPALQVAPAVASAVSAPVSTPGTASEPPFVRRTMLARRMYALVVAARRHGLRRDDDVALFVEHGINLHSEFYRHALFATRLANLDHELSFPYQHAVSDLTQGDMHRVKLETSGI